MKYVILFTCIMAAAIADEKYTDKYDNFNVDEILSNTRLLTNYLDCCMDRGPCTPEGKELKNHLQDAIETGCSKCTEVQQKQTLRIIKHLIEKERAMWDEVAAKFDPTGKWRKEYEDRARAEGIFFP